MTDRFIELLVEATTRIPENYFQLPVAGKEEPIYRERVYCYELYHQLRMLLEAAEHLSCYTLSGEIDKKGHPVIRACSPDFVFHLPGDRNANIAVVEVKPANGAIEGIKKDLETLSYFVSEEIGYQLGIHLVYGGQEADLVKFTREFQSMDAQRLQLFWHPRHGEGADRRTPDPRERHTAGADGTLKEHPH